MATGKVKVWKDAQGYGFITPDNGDSDLFVHFSGIKSGYGRKGLTDGARVEFDAENSDKGPKAVNVVEL
jgi:CspA family cold shock protein